MKYKKEQKALPLVKQKFKRECEICHVPKRGKYMMKTPTGHWICSLCSRSQGSATAMRKAEAYAMQMKNKQRIFKTDEERALWAAYQQKKLSYSEMEARLRNLRYAVAFRRRSSYYENKNAPGTSFAEEFRKLKERKK